MMRWPEIAETNTLNSCESFSYAFPAEIPLQNPGMSMMPATTAMGTDMFVQGTEQNIRGGEASRSILWRLMIRPKKYSVIHKNKW